MEGVYRAVAGLVKGSLRVLRWRVEVTGLEHLPGAGPAVLAANHVSYLDPVMLGWAADRVGRPVRFLAKQELFSTPGLAWVLRRTRQIPVDRFGTPEGSLAGGLQALRRGDLVGVFPEGTISRSFVPKEAKTGAARLALSTAAPLVPVALWGGQRIATKGRPRSLQRDVRLAVRIGPPVACAAHEDPHAVTERLMAALTDLVAVTADAYPRPAGACADLSWLPRHLGGTAPTPEQAAEDDRRERARRREQRGQRKGPGRSRGL